MDPQVGLLTRVCLVQVTTLDRTAPTAFSAPHPVLQDCYSSPSLAKAGWTPECRDQPASCRGEDLKAAPLGKEGLCPGPRPTVEGFPSPFSRGRAKGGQAKGLLEGTESHLQDWTQQDWGAIRPKTQEERNL